MMKYLEEKYIAQIKAATSDEEIRAIVNEIYDEGKDAGIEIAENGENL